MCQAYTLREAKATKFLNSWTDPFSQPEPVVWAIGWNAWLADQRGRVKQVKNECTNKIESSGVRPKPTLQTNNGRLTRTHGSA